MLRAVVIPVRGTLQIEFLLPDLAQALRLRGGAPPGDHAKRPALPDHNSEIHEFLCFNVSVFHFCLKFRGLGRSVPTDCDLHLRTKGLQRGWSRKLGRTVPTPLPSMAHELLPHVPRTGSTNT